MDLQKLIKSYSQPLPGNFCSFMSCAERASIVYVVGVFIWNVKATNSQRTTPPNFLLRYSFIKPIDGQWWVAILAKMQKNKKVDRFFLKRL